MYIINKIAILNCYFLLTKYKQKFYNLKRKYQNLGGDKMDRTYMCIDLKSFYASVECVERNLDPITTNLVVADNSRTEKTICLAVTPALKQYGLSGRSRLFEVVQKVNEVNYILKDSKLLFSFKRLLLLLVFMKYKEPLLLKEYL